MYMNKCQAYKGYKISNPIHNLIWFFWPIILYDSFIVILHILRTGRFDKYGKVINKTTAHSIKKRVKINEEQHIYSSSIFLKPVPCPLCSKRMNIYLHIRREGKSPDQLTVILSFKEDIFSSKKLYSWFYLHYIQYASPNLWNGVAYIVSTPFYKHRETSCFL